MFPKPCPRFSKSFFATYIANHFIYTDVNKLRYDMFAQKYQGKSGQLLSSYDGVDLSLLPPSRGSLQMHIKKATYQAYIWLHADQPYPDVPSPEGHGWKLADDNSIDYEWTSGCFFQWDWST